MIGVCFVLQPWRDTFKPSFNTFVLGYNLSILYGLFETTGMVIVNHFAYLQTRENQNTVLFWLTFTGTFISLCISLPTEKLTIPQNWADLTLVIVHCTTYSLIIYLNIYCYSTVPGVIYSLIHSTEIIYLVIAQYTFLAGIKSGNQNWLEVCGCGIIFICSILPSAHKAYKSYKAEEESRDNS